MKKYTITDKEWEQVLDKVKTLEKDNDYLTGVIEGMEKAFSLQTVNQCLPSDEKMHDDLLTIIDTNLSCGTGQEAGILCNRFATTSFIRDYIKKLLANCG
jgi:hypothetical protein